MAFRLILIALITYALGVPDTAALIGRYVFHTELSTRSMGYVKFFKHFHGKGVGYLLLADALRALVAVLVGGLLLKGPGFPTVGKQLAMFFALLGQAMPLTRQFRSREDLVFPMLLLLFVDWRVFLIVLAVSAVLLVLTGRFELPLLCALVLYPLFTLIFGGWWLKVLLALLTSAGLFHIYHDKLLRFLTALRKPAPAPAKAPAADVDEADEPEA